MKDDLSLTLFGKTRRAVLTLLLTCPDEEFYLRQIVLEAGTGLGATQRELATLVSSGIIERHEKGVYTAQEYRKKLNAKHPFLY